VNARRGAEVSEPRPEGTPYTWRETRVKGPNRVAVRGKARPPFPAGREGPVAGFEPPGTPPNLPPRHPGAPSPEQGKGPHPTHQKYLAPNFCTVGKWDRPGSSGIGRLPPGVFFWVSGTRPHGRLPGFNRGVSVRVRTRRGHVGFPNPRTALAPWRGEPVAPSGRSHVRVDNTPGEGLPSHGRYIRVPQRGNRLGWGPPPRQDPAWGVGGESLSRVCRGAGFREGPGEACGPTLSVVFPCRRTPREPGATGSPAGSGDSPRRSAGAENPEFPLPTWRVGSHPGSPGERWPPVRFSKRAFLAFLPVR
jgi:hypothetical protein